MLESNHHLGENVKSLTFPRYQELNEQIVLPLASISTIRHPHPAVMMDSGIEVAKRSIYSKLTKLQTLVIHYPSFLPPFQIRSKSGKLAPPQFFSSSLKKLFIPLWGVDAALKAKNILWILLQCEQLEEAALACSFDLDDFKLLSDHQVAFASQSNVKKLSLQFYFYSK